MAGERPSSRTDPALIKAIARGHCWFNDLASNRAKDTREIAQREGVRSYVRRLIPYAFLAPSIVEAIRMGNQPADLTAEKLTRRKLSHLWIEQRSALGWTPGHVD
jgi:site-specific DNA recombinase